MKIYADKPTPSGVLVLAWKFKVIVIKNKNMKIKVLTKEGEKTLFLTPSEYEDLQYEISGQKSYIQEYKTIDGEILTDLDIELLV